MTAPRGFFITGTDTGVGKTRVAAGLCHALAQQGMRVAAMKPVASGSMRTAQGLRNDDALALQAAANVRATYDEINPYAFEPAIAPHIAAAEAGVSVDLEKLDRAFERLKLRSNVIVVEGAGGWLAPLAADFNCADLAAHWRLPVILVVGLRLGCLNHALLSVEAIERRGLPLAGWVANHIEPAFERAAENIHALATGIRAPCLGTLPFAPHADGDSIAACLEIKLLPAGTGIVR